MSSLLSTDPADHPIAEERIGFVDGQIMFIHAAQAVEGRVWADRAGARVSPAWVRDLTSIVHVLELANHLIESGPAGKAHQAASALSNWRAGIEDHRLDDFDRQLARMRETYRLAGGLPSC